MMRRLLVLVLAALALVGVLATPSAMGRELADDAGAEWRVEQPPPPPPPPGVESSSVPIGLGRVGDIEFYEPNRGALITAGNGSTVGPGVWFYDGAGWVELSDQCGATDGRIAWAGPDEFWTISDGRAGAASAGQTEKPPLEDNTLCRFGSPAPEKPLQILASYASPPFQANSYRPMHAAGCLSPTDCWFGGEPLLPPQIGTFELHWNGNDVEAAAYTPEGHAAWDLQPFEGSLFESLRVLGEDRDEKNVPFQAAMFRINPPGAAKTIEREGVRGVLYEEAEEPTALDYLHLSSDGGSLWAAAGPSEATSGPEGGITVIRKAAGQPWSQVLSRAAGRSRWHETSGSEQVSQRLLSAAAEPGTESAWVGLDSKVDASRLAGTQRARVARVNANGVVTDELELPEPGERESEPGERYGPLGAAWRMACPAVHDCWLVTTAGWLVHLAPASERTLGAPLADPVFAQIESGTPITTRPPDLGVPQEPSDELPADTSGEETFVPKEQVIKGGKEEPAKVKVPLVSHVRSKLINGTTLQLSFHLAVRARVQLVAHRKRALVAKTPMETLKAGNRSLRLKLNRRRWPTKLSLNTHALAPLPTITSAAPTVGAISTPFVAPARLLREVLR